MDTAPILNEESLVDPLVNHDESNRRHILILVVKVVDCLFELRNFCLEDLISLCIANSISVDDEGCW